LGGALEAREISASGDRLTAVARGEVEVEEGVLVLKRIHVIFALKDVSPDKIPAAERAHEVFKPKCPVYRSLHRAIDITTGLTINR
jgi:uncharacterized OsmC-like protein